MKRKTNIHQPSPSSNALESGRARPRLHRFVSARRAKPSRFSMNDLRDGAQLRSLIKSSASRSTSDFWFFYDFSGPRISGISQCEAFGFGQPFDKIGDLRVILITSLWPRETEQVLRGHAS